MKKVICLYFIFVNSFLLLQAQDNDACKLLMVQNINNDKLEEALDNIKCVEDWSFSTNNEEEYLDFTKVNRFVNFIYTQNFSEQLLDSFYLFLARELNASSHLAYIEGNYKSALTGYNLVANIQKNILGETSEFYGETLTIIGNIYEILNDYSSAEKFHLEALAIHKSMSNGLNTYYATDLNNLANLYNTIGNYEEAEEMYKESIRIWVEIFGENNINCTVPMGGLCVLYTKKGDFLNAEVIIKKNLDIIKRTHGNWHPDYATSLMNLGEIYLELGDYIKAKDTYEKSLKIYERNYGVKHSDYAINLKHLGIVYYQLSDYKSAETKYKEALNIFLEIFGEEHGSYTSTLHCLAVLYYNMGNYDVAEKYYLEVLEVEERIMGKQNLGCLPTLYQLSLVYFAKGNYEMVEQYLLNILRRTYDLCGKLNPNYAKALNALGGLYDVKEDYMNAEITCKEVLEIRRKVLGEEHPDYANSLNNLANVYSKMGNYSEAEKLHKEALKIQEKVLGEEHPFYAISLSNLSFVYCKTQQYGKTESLLFEHSGIIKKHIKTNFQNLSEHERQLYWNTQSHHFNIYYPSFCYLYYLQKKSISEFAYNNAILTKGLLLNASTQVQNAILNSGNQMLIEQWNELLMLRHQILKLQEKTLEEQKIIGIDSLQERANELDKQLTAMSVDYKQGKDIWDIKWNDVKKKLKPNEVAIEFISFDYYHKGEFTDSTLYCALLLRNNSQYPEMITLFEEKEISVFANKTVDGKVASNLIYSFFVNEEDGDTTGYGMKLSQLVWSKILPKIKEGETIYFSPSGLFHQLAIESLPYDENRRMSDVYNLVRLSSTREIVLNKGNSNQYSTATLYGGIHYDTSSKDLLAESNNYSQETLLASRGVENDTLDRGSVDYLPGTKKEVEKINKMLVDNNITAQLYTKNQANEESFKNLSNKHQNIIHIGTHGFTWTDSVAKKKDYFAERMQIIGEEQQYRGPIIDPLNRCGLLFAGANIALQGKSRELPEGVQDGILTAKEISLLDLRDCDLVVLSACETAKGDITSEGVFGLQRAFKMAGVQTIIMSLWKVDDEATQKLMTEFYNNWIVKKQTKREAFKNAQNAVREKYEEPIYWAGFVMLD